MCVRSHPSYVSWRPISSASPMPVIIWSLSKHLKENLVWLFVRINKLCFLGYACDLNPYQTSKAFFFFCECTCALVFVGAVSYVPFYWLSYMIPKWKHKFKHFDKGNSFSTKRSYFCFIKHIACIKDLNSNAVKKKIHSCLNLMINNNHHITNVIGFVSFQPSLTKPQEVTSICLT